MHGPTCIFWANLTPFSLKYLDMCNSPGPYALGAADPDVNAAVIAAVESGSFSTLNPPEEVE
jgi:glutamate-1-semialdehyde aminotransferase